MEIQCNTLKWLPQVKYAWLWYGDGGFSTLYGFDDDGVRFPVVNGKKKSQWKRTCWKCESES